MLGISKIVYRVNCNIYYQSNSMCSCSRTIDGMGVTFGMEQKLTKLYNLTGHVTKCKGAKDNSNKKKNKLTSEEKINVKWSAKIMVAYLKEDKLNPAIVVIYKGFFHIFSAWIIDKSLHGLLKRH